MSEDHGHCTEQANEFILMFRRCCCGHFTLEHKQLLPEGSIPWYDYEKELGKCEECKCKKFVEQDTTF